MSEVLVPIVFSLFAIGFGHAIGIERGQSDIAKQCVEKKQFEADRQRYECRKLTARYE